MKCIIKKYANRKLHLEGTVKYLSMLDLWIWPRKLPSKYRIVILERTRTCCK